MIQEYQLRVLPEVAANEQRLKEYLVHEKGLNAREITATRILKRSIDARQRTIYINLNVRAYLNEMPKEDEYQHTLYNNVEGIAKKAAEISSLVDEAKVSFAHGKMTGKEIEEIMADFVTQKTNVLVCTTILESGIDIPNANTIIVENAERLGLAQLYQIRGRVGRSNKQAYAYIMYKRDKILSEVANKRLKSIKEFTEFGSGFKIAMRDLEIR